MRSSRYRRTTSSPEGQSIGAKVPPVREQQTPDSIPESSGLEDSFPPSWTPGMCMAREWDSMETEGLYSGRGRGWRETDGVEGGGECGGRGRVWRERDRVEGESGG